jgi:hypothetical protein
MADKNESAEADQEVIQPFIKASAGILKNN